MINVQEEISFTAHSSAKRATSVHPDGDGTSRFAITDADN